MRGVDVLVIGAGVVGAACAYHAARAGLRVVVVDRGGVAGGTTGAGEGNLLVSDKEPGPELDLALLSARRWREIAAERGLGELIEYERKGGLVVADGGVARAGLDELATRQRAAGVDAVAVGPDDLAEVEPQLAGGLAGGVLYPQDAQVQPALAAAHLLAAEGCAGTGRVAGRAGAGRVEVRAGVTVTGFRRSAGRIVGVRTDRGDIAAGAVVNAAGTWGGEVARLAGVHLPVLPRRGFILVTEPLPALVRHKVYAAEYVANVASDAAGLETSAVVEGTRSGSVLIGASRELAGFDRTMSIPVLRRLAGQAIALFPVLAGAAVIRAFCGFRPYCPDHLPVIGPDPRAPGLWHACGHEGAGVGLAAGTGHLLAQALTGAERDLDLAPFRPDRFVEAGRERL